MLSVFAFVVVWSLRFGFVFAFVVAVVAFAVAVAFFAIVFLFLSVVWCWCCGLWFVVVVFGKPFHLSDNNNIAQCGTNVNTNFLFAVYRKGTTPLCKRCGGMCPVWAGWSMSHFRTMRHWAGWLWFFWGLCCGITVVVGSSI